MGLRWLSMILLTAVTGCQTLPISRLLNRESGAPSLSLSTTSDILPCAATVPASTSTTVAFAAPNETAKTPPPSEAGRRSVPATSKTDEAAGVCPVPLSENGSQPLTLADLEQLALSNNPTISQAAALVRQQEGLTRQAGLYPNPQAGYLRTDADQSGKTQTEGVFLSQEIVTAGKLRLAVQAGRQDVQLRNWQLNAQQTRVLNDLRVRFYEVLGAQQAVQAAKELVGLAGEGVRVAEQLLAAKQGARSDVLQAKMQLSLIRSSLQDAEYRHRSAWRHLANIVGVPDLPPTPVAGGLENGIPELNEKESLERLLATSPLLKAQEAELRAATIELQLARAQAFPNVSVQVVAQRDNVQNFSSVSTLIALPVPLFNRNQGNIINAEGVLIQQQKEYERLRLALSDQLAASFRTYLTSRAQAQRLEQEILPMAKENLELTTKAYQAGRMDFLRVLNARQSYFQANLAHIDALTELHKVVVEIEGLQLTGGLNPTEVGTALQTTPGAGTTGLRGVLLQQLQEQRGTGSRNLPGAIQAGER